MATTTIGESDSNQNVISPELVRGMEEADSAKAQNRALLRLVRVLEKGTLQIFEATLRPTDLFAIRIGFKDDSLVSH